MAPECTTQRRGVDACGPARRTKGGATGLNLLKLGVRVRVNVRAVQLSFDGGA